MSGELGGLFGAYLPQQDPWLQQQLANRQMQAMQNAFGAGRITVAPPPPPALEYVVKKLNKRTGPLATLDDHVEDICRTARHRLSSI